VLAQTGGGFRIAHEREPVQSNTVGDPQRRPAPAVDDAFEPGPVLDQEVDRKIDAPRYMTPCIGVSFFESTSFTVPPPTSSVSPFV
jgi:hypothetical protein